MSHSCNNLGPQLKRCYLLSQLLTSPFWSLFGLLTVLLYKEQEATPFQLSLCIAIRPIVALLSPYWSQMIHAKRERLMPNLYLGTLLKFAPFLFFPWVNNIYFFLLAFALFNLLHRATMPAWMELFKQHFSAQESGRIYTRMMILDYLLAALFPFLLGSLLDIAHTLWRELFSLSALIGLLSAIWMFRFPSLSTEKEGRFPQQELPSTQARAPAQPATHLQRFAHWIASPFVSGYGVLKQSPAFLYFQGSFFLAGAGLMIVQPILPHFYVAHLGLSYQGIGLAVTSAKGIGLVLSSPLWLRYFHKVPIFTFAATVAFCASFFSLLLMFASAHVGLIYLALLLYGSMQGGSKLVWNMSGPIFAQQADSTPFSSINLMTVGIRGVIFPFLGAYLFAQWHSFSLLFLSSHLLCLAATCSFLFLSSRSQFRPSLQPSRPS